MKWQELKTEWMSDRRKVARLFRGVCPDCGAQQFREGPLYGHEHCMVCQACGAMFQGLELVSATSRRTLFAWRVVAGA